MILYYAFDREMLNSVGFSDLDREGQWAIETKIEDELKCLIFVMPLDERVVISPSFRFESVICRKILLRNRAFTDRCIIAEYRREASPKDFWLKKNETYRSAMAISEEYRKIYGEKSTFSNVSSIWIDHIPKREIIGQVIRDIFMQNVRQHGKKFSIPSVQIEDVLKVTDETREDTFLWEVEEHKLHKYGISDKVIRLLGVRESMNQSYLDVFASQGFEICKSCLGLADIEYMNPAYDMTKINAILDRLGILRVITSLYADGILSIRGNPELQNLLDILRDHLKQNKSVADTCKAMMEAGNPASLISKLLLQPSGGSHMNPTDTSMELKILQEGTLRILHLSDLHFTDESTMHQHYFYLKLDLMSNFKLTSLDYLIISGDVSDRPEETMYKAALVFVQCLIKDFKIPVEHVILIPGNHDCDREISKKAYGRKKQIANQKLYHDRYSKYNQYFYEPIKGKPYPMDPALQFEDFIFAEDSLCFLGLNSCWQIDHKYTERSSICMDAIQKSQTIWCSAEDYIKLAVWHHPLSGWACIQDTTFMETLANAGFKVCFHGHIHEAKNDLFTYDAFRNIRMVGAGTFGAVQKERGDGIPRQYNMIELDKEHRILIVHTRKREKDEGTWQADARWNDKNHNPRSYYTVNVNTKV